MQLNLGEIYKSLTPFSIETPNFVVLTGVNGAGKTHLLSGIGDGVVKVTENGEVLRNRKHITSNSLLTSLPINKGIDIYQERNRFIHFYESFLNHKNFNSDVKIENFIQNLSDIQILNSIASKLDKKAEELSVDDIYRTFPLPEFITIDVIKDIFFGDYATLFRRYYNMREENQYRQFLTLQKNYGYEYKTDEEFTREYGEPPWEILNKIIVEGNLGFCIKYPSNLHRDAPIEFKLISNDSGREISVRDLSSGEKVIMSLLFTLYNFNHEFEIPQLLLMDEPDASLHPSMTKQFLNVIENVFVKEKRIKVIITTHSPSTVALANEKALFVMNKTKPRIEKIRKDKALKILTTGVPSLSINYENRKQVFVESKYDVFCYENLYNKLNEKLISEISLDFISSGVGGAGSCEQVKEIVNKLAGFGNKSIFGIIDWDCKNNGNENVFVPGKGKRYSIENYIFDPILITAFLLREKFISRNDLGLADNINHTDFKNLSTEQLQTIADFLIKRISAFIEILDETPEKIKYVNGIEIDVPKWYLVHDGHDLETQLKNTFKPLNQYQKEAPLKEEIIRKVIDEIPEFIPIDILELFEMIQKS